MSSTGDKLRAKVDGVVANDNCSGCGVCASAFSGITMALSADGFMRPQMTAKVESENTSDAYLLFDEVCPGRQVAAPGLDAGATVHPIFGRSVGVWEGWSTDPDIRRAGSSGGVLTAIASYVSERADLPAQMVTMDRSQPTKSVPVRIISRDEALKAAGSRYAPVSIGAAGTEGTSSVTGKPCEIAGIRRANRGGGAGPLLLSFFCAGTPSQFATDQLVRDLGHDARAVTSTRYRGDGWPGKFVVTSTDGRTSSKSYEESWGDVLGKQLQARCKICVDGTGESADIAVGDYWAADEAGYPKFEDSDGRSVVIARTVRGLRTLEDCLNAGIIELRPISLESVANIQPLQVKRRLTLPGRLFGRVLTGRQVPRYPGYALLPIFLRYFVPNLRAAAGTVRRGLRNSRTTK